MSRSALFIVAAWMALAPTAHAGEQCFATLSPPGAAIQVVPLPEFVVVESEGDLALPQSLTDVVAISCRRATLVMSDRDHRVLTDLHLPFAFSDGERLVWLYVEDLRLSMHMDEGELTREEREQIEGAMARAQEIMLRDGW